METKGTRNSDSGAVATASAPAPAKPPTAQDARVAAKRTIDESLMDLKHMNKALERNTQIAGGEVSIGRGISTNQATIFSPSDITIFNECYTMMMKHSGDAAAAMITLPEIAIAPLSMAAKYPVAFHAALLEDWILNGSGLNQSVALEACKSVEGVMTLMTKAPKELLQITSKKTILLKMAQVVVQQQAVRNGNKQAEAK